MYAGINYVQGIYSICTNMHTKHLRVPLVLYQMQFRDAEMCKHAELQINEELVHSLLEISL